MFTHVDKSGRPAMVAIGQKEWTFRRAKAQALVWAPKEVMDQIRAGQNKKGPVIETAILAGTQAVKKCWELIPLCHTLPIEGCRIDIQLDELIRIECEVETVYKTGVEMEALTGASIAALTVYDMCKAMSHQMEIRSVVLLEKSGGKADYVRSQ